ncbi:type IV secretory system conjugative DNA transfer family protein [candidate division KSB1 bacterium]|nr:type IV secretory system conjugative DNA transfer family protein [candidate division KSB1 bacterium]
MKIFFKLLYSLLVFPFLIPWFFADKSFEYLFQPAIFRRYNLEIARKKIWTLRIVKIVPLFLLGGYVIERATEFFLANKTVYASLKNVNVLFIVFYNDVVKALNFLLTPLNHLLYYIRGGYIQFRDFFISGYVCLFIVLFIINVLYRLIKTHTTINQAVVLRNQAIRDVDLIHYTKRARTDEVFLGLDINRGGQPFYAKRNWLKGHMQVIGGPGSGKTESIIQPLWFQEVSRNAPTFVLDGKASTQNVDKFYTIATSLAQRQDVYYFNPLDPERSATYNPLLRGSVGDIKRKIMASINWNEYSPASREKLDAALYVILRAIEASRSNFTLREIFEYFQSIKHVGRQIERVNDRSISDGLNDIVSNYRVFQADMFFFIELLHDLFQSGYAPLLNTQIPEIDIVDIYVNRKDCYFTLPLQQNDKTIRFLGQLILQDILYSFNFLSGKRHENEVNEGLLIVDELAKFISTDFLKLLQASRNVGVYVCYTNQSISELDDPSLNLSSLFVDQLADHTNVVCCLQLTSPKSIQALINRFGKTESQHNEGKRELNIDNPDFLSNLDVGGCVVYVRHPRNLAVLKTGYFQFDKLMRFGGQNT